MKPINKEPPYQFAFSSLEDPSVRIVGVAPGINTQAIQEEKKCNSNTTSPSKDEREYII